MATPVRFLVDADHAAVVGEGQRGVAEHVGVVLVRDPVLRRQVRRTEQAEELCLQRGAVGRSVERGGGVGLQRVDPGRVGDRAVVDRAVDGDGARVDVHDLLALPVDDESARAGDLAQHAGLDLPLADDAQELVELVGADDRHHALLALRHQDLFGGERGVAEQDVVERDVHAAVTVAREPPRWRRRYPRRRGPGCPRPGPSGTARGSTRSGPSRRRGRRPARRDAWSGRPR